LNDDAPERSRQRESQTAKRPISYFYFFF
jgi:hypothetical protein